MKVAVVVGASRGIGMQVARCLLEQGCDVYATCRSGNSELEQLTGPHFHVVQGIDVGQGGGCDGLPASVPDQIDILVLNAGVYAKDDIDSIDFASLRLQLEVNALGPLRAVLPVREKLRSGAKVVIIGSKLGSMTVNSTGYREGQYGYKMSKAAAHMAATNLAADLKGAGVAVCIVHPGVVMTDMTKLSGSQTTLTAEDSAKGIVERVTSLSMETSGKFWDYLGNELPW